ncbi:MAG: NUDIX domain-containing protein [Hamadaea sp.]|nr:NUDIX domain-containing protein [Hamadaea sp.]
MPDPAPRLFPAHAGVGLRYGTVRVVDHHDAWAEVAHLHTTAIRDLLHHHAVAVEHVGSTAVAGLAAKPIADVAVRLASHTAPSHVIAALTDAGYLFRGDCGDGGGLLFVAETQPGLRQAHVHVVGYDDPQFERYLAVRDRLRGDPQAAAAYAALKRGLAEQHPDDRAAYTAAKTGFLTGLLDRARPAPTIVRRARALLITPGGNVLTVRRHRPGHEPYWMLPGGGIEPDDTSLEAAVLREVTEETGGRPDLHRLVDISPLYGTRHAIYVGRIDAWDERRRTGPELDNPVGSYHLEEIPVDPDRLADGTIWPTTAMASVAAHVRRGADLFALPDIRHSTLVHWRTRQRPQPWSGAIAMVTTSAVAFAIAAERAAVHGLTLEHVDLDLPGIESTSAERVARHKAEAAYGLLHRPVVVEDSGLGDDGTATAALAYADACGVTCVTRRPPGDSVFAGFARWYAHDEDHISLP